METQEIEYVQAYIDVEHTVEGAIYVSQETTRMIVADAWSGIEEQLTDANAAFNAVADEPHERILAILNAAKQITKYADVIYYLTPMPEERDEE